METQHWHVLAGSASLYLRIWLQVLRLAPKSALILLLVLGSEVLAKVIQTSGSLCNARSISIPESVRCSFPSLCRILTFFLGKWKWSKVVAVSLPSVLPLRFAIDARITGPFNFSDYVFLLIRRMPILSVTFRSSVTVSYHAAFTALNGVAGIVSMPTCVNTHNVGAHVYYQNRLDTLPLSAHCPFHYWR